jgi:hypothetical protein
MIDATTGIAGDQGFTFIGSGLYTGAAGQLRFGAPSVGELTWFRSGHEFRYDTGGIGIR